MAVMRNERVGETARAVSLVVPVPVSDEDVDAIDGCDVEIVDETPDEELPPTEGGIA